jgi:hypothetical protein
MKINAVIFLIIILFSSCERNKRDIERAFYYWKNNDKLLDTSEVSFIKRLNIKKLYIKFFEVKLDINNDPVPFAKTTLNINHQFPNKIKDSLFLKRCINVEIIPVVFIKNDVFLRISDNGIDSLVLNMKTLIEKYFQDKFKNNFNKTYYEIQIDCDWTKGTKDKYFSFLTKFKIVSAKTISCTLRLYPFKYPNKMGIPPIDKATLMCYNLINPFEYENQNSIQNNKELEKYLRNSKKYPLHLDFVLPIFSWMQVYKNNRFACVINPLEIDTSFMIALKYNWFMIKKDFDNGSIFLRPSDKLKFEESTTQELNKTVILLRKYIDLSQNTTISLFHLDARNFKKYKYEELNHFYTGFNQ